ncbi:MAG: response regulator [Deltaproteobacteria bacterium]|nr:response regulator [Deltaproteobacteria bacterium]MBN2672238.1 response regulator [Deltaproteobacteria bacterium]
MRYLQSPQRNRPTTLPSRVRSTISFVFIAGMFVIGCTSESPAAHRGTLHIPDSFFTQQPSLSLEGQWEFFPNQLYTPTDFTDNSSPISPLFVSVPGDFRQYAESLQQNEEIDYGTYRLRVYCRDTDRLAINMGDTWSAYTIWVNGVLQAKSGVVGTDTRTEHYRYGRTLIPKLPKSSTYDILIQVSNFHASAGGLLQAPELGIVDHITRSHQFSWIWRSFILGALFIMGFYHLTIYLFRRKELSNMFVSGYCWLWGINFAVTTTSVWMFLSVFPHVPIDFLRRVDHVTFYLSIPVNMYLVLSLYPNEISRRIVRWSAIFFLATSIISCLLPLQAAETTVVYMLVIIAPTLFYAFSCVTRALLRKRPGAILVFAGYIILTSTAVNDMLLISRLVPTMELVFIGIFLFMLLQSMAVSLRFAQAFNANELLSKQLEHKNEELARINAIKDEFLTNTSHELRTPLHGISGVAESLLAPETLSNATVLRDNVNLIISSSQRLLYLVNDVLDYSRLKHKDITLQIKPVDLHTLSGTVLETMRHLTLEKPISLESAFPEKLPLVMADENRLTQIIFNLLGNGINATQDGFVRIGARVEDNHVIVSVQDSGQGISEEKQHRIFDSFEQGDEDLAQGIGTGIGLHVTKQLVALHGGEIRVSSVVNQGSTFEFALQIADESAAATVADSKQTASQISAHTDTKTSLVKDDAYHILAVDDEAVNLRVLSNHLGREGMTVQLAYDGASCLTALEDAPDCFDLILLDLNMPGINGLEVCRRIRKQHSPEKLPIVILTARTGPAALAAGFECGANDYIEKPFSREELLSRVQLHVKLKKAYEGLEDRMRMEVELEKRRHSETEARWNARQQQLEKLRFQFAPHFLFNALNSIRASIIDDPEAARNMLSTLAELNRMAIERRTKTAISISEEMEMVILYLSMEQARYGDYLSATTHIEEETAPLPVPCFILQPLVENAIKHGKQTSQESLHIHVSTHCDRDTLFLQVTNSGSWISPDEPRTGPSTGFGLIHLRERLQYWNAQLVHEESDGKVQVTIQIPQSAILQHNSEHGSYLFNYGEKPGVQ